MDEQAVIDYWKKNGTRKKALALRRGGQKWFFLDGPPYATGYIHMGTALNKILKDYYMRYKRMRGLDVHAQPGYDSHGLPIENKIEKELGLKSKKEIESKVGVAEFNKKCKEFAGKFIGIMNSQFDDLGVWMDWERPYVTYEKDYMLGAWHTFGVAYEKGLLYRDKQSLHVCPRCETVSAYNEIEYAKRRDPAVFVRLELKDRPGEYLLVWTTTPWTLPSNVAVMAHPDFEYALVETKHGKLWIAKELAEKIIAKLSGGKIVDSVRGAEMKGWEYENLMKVPQQARVKPRVVLSEEFVNLSEGTGLVHTAPGHGAEDFQIAKANNLPVLSPLGMDGRFSADAGSLAGLEAKKADPVIVSELKAQGSLVLEESIEHEYPHCWRCQSPLLFMAVDQWFFRIKQMKEALIAQNAAAPWVPGWAGKRFENWLQGIGDWPVGRQRYWGIPLPIWVCAKCERTRVVGNEKELGVKLDDIHRPFIDAVTLECDCGGTMKRVPDVLDVWFDSGVAPWASLGFPGRHMPFETLWPVDFVLEGPDQTRGWWNSLTICGYITTGRQPFDHIFQHGMVLAEGGVKMSKSRGNVVEPSEVVKKYSRDVLRYQLLRNDSSEDFDFSWAKAEESRKFFTILENCFNFFKLYCSKAALPDGLRPEDKWMLSRVNSLVGKATEQSESFQHHKAVQAVEEFVIQDLSRWYIKLIRERTWPTYDGADKAAANATLYYVLDRLARLLAPALPFHAEGFNLGLFGWDSVHLQHWPDVEDEMLNRDLEDEMSVVMKVTEASAAARQKAGLKLRWPLETLSVQSEDPVVKRAVNFLGGLLAASCNVKKVVLNQEIAGEAADFDKGRVIIDTVVTDSLLSEALAKELIRAVQALRKKAGLKVGDRIALTVEADAGTAKLLKKASQAVSEKVNAASFAVGKAAGEFSDELKFEEKAVKVAFSRA